MRATPNVVDQYIASEVSSNKLVEADTELAVHINPIGIILKPHQLAGTYRLIVDLSSPRGFSVNDGLPPELCSVNYVKVDDAVTLVRQMGPRALMPKLDLKSAYRMVPVHELDQPLLGIVWNEVTYIDRALPFGLRSAPLIFTAVADGLAWAMNCCGVIHVLHYLDDFFFCGPTASEACNIYLQIALELCLQLGFPVAAEKVEGPSPVITFLGIEIDSIKQELRLPAEKLRRVKTITDTWLSKTSASKRELQSLLGHLHHAATVVKPGRSFTHNLIETLKRLNRGSQKVRLDAACRADITCFLADWNGIAFLATSSPSFHVVSDASGSWGCAAINLVNGQWFQIQWPEQWADVNIAIKELVPVVVAAAVWGQLWVGSSTEFNQAAVVSLNC